MTAHNLGFAIAKPFRAAVATVTFSLAACSELPPPIPLQRALSADGSGELVLWQYKPGSILESHIFLTAARPNAAFAHENIVTSFFMAEDFQAYWADANRPVVLARRFYGSVGVNEPAANTLAALCIGRLDDCRRSHPPVRESTILRLANVNRGEPVAK